MMFEIITKGVEAMPQKIPRDWEESTVINLEEEVFTVIFKNGNVSFTEGDKPDAESIIQLTTKRLCDTIDGSTDFMKVWMDLAEPAGKSAVVKGSGIKFLTLLDLLSRTYKSNSDFKKVLDENKADLGQI